MTDILLTFLATLMDTVFDIFPIIAILFGFQFLVLRKRLPNLTTICVGFVFVLFGLAFFLMGLEDALFPLGRTMARQLTDMASAGNGIGGALDWQHYLWVYVFAAAIGFSTTIAEPSLIAVAMKADEISGGSLGAWGLRIAVAIGVAIGVALGAYRIVSGTPLHYYIMAGYGIVIIQTFFASKWIIPLAYDSGGVTTSTVTVPLVAALGLGLATTIPGRNPLIDGFGLIAFASLFPIVSVLGYAQIGDWLERRRTPPQEE